MLKNGFRIALQCMIWPVDSYSQGEEEEPLQIHFEKVKRANGEIVPSTFVIVVYVAQCPGGVFVEEPEAYEFKDGEAKKLDFTTWKKYFMKGLKRDQGWYNVTVQETLTGLVKKFHQACPGGNFREETLENIHFSNTRSSNLKRCRSSDPPFFKIHFNSHSFNASNNLLNTRSFRLPSLRMVIILSRVHQLMVNCHSNRWIRLKIWCK